jgi:quinolinate synthase
MTRQNTFEKRVESLFPKKQPKTYTTENKQILFDKIKKQLSKKQTVLIAHYYVSPEIQALAEETGGFIGDSLEMAKFGASHSAQALVIAGVRFMGETAKILSPDKTILMPDLNSECSLDVGCNHEELADFRQKYPDRTLVVYANTSAKVKSIADWVVTSSMAVDLINHLAQKGEKLIWAPDKYLGNYLKSNTNADLLLWDACCVVHSEFDAQEIKRLQKKYPNAAVLVHPESKPEVVALADVIGSTSQLLKASISMKNEEFIVATETGVFYKMKQASPNKTFIAAGTQKTSSIIDCHAECPWMKMNNLDNLLHVLETGNNKIEIPADIIEKALIPLQRMVDFKKG